MISERLGSASIRRWVDAVRGSEVPTGLSVDEATRGAKAILLGIQAGQPPAVGSRTGPELADEIYAICRLIAREDGASESKFRSATVLHGAVEQMVWPDDDLDEKSQLLTRVSYLAWLHARRWGNHPEVALWEERTASRALGQDSVRAFLAIPVDARSDELNSRFLCDPGVLLASCVRLRNMLETSPLAVSREAKGTRDWLVQNSQVCESREEWAFFAAELAWILAGSDKQCGRYVDCQAWLDELEQNCDEVIGAESLMARASYLRLAVLHHQYSYEEVLEQMPALKEVFARLGMLLSLAKCSYLEAITLKQLGKDADARIVFDSLSRDPEVLRERWLHALVLMGTAELEGRTGRFAAAEADLLLARDLLQDSGSSMSIGHLHAIHGELLRDQGLLLEASEAYRAAVAVYSMAGMAAMATYLRVVLAETLLATRDENKAIQEIVRALPAIGEMGLVREAKAAIALLSESLRRQKVDPSALRELREQLDRMRKDGEL